MDLIDRAEVLYKFAEILPEAGSIEWYEQAKPDEVKALVDEMYSIVLNVNTMPDVRLIDANALIKTIKGDHCKGCNKSGFIRRIRSFYGDYEPQRQEENE